ncbi:MAG: glycosyltransferase family A protein [Spirochaetales bacterium]|nr:glycosyltransferase family A protein [Spirochaetales bacterium]
MINFSLIIPVYNRRALVLEALETVLAQTLPPAQIIVADDGSTDGTAEGVREFFRQRGNNPNWTVLEGTRKGYPGAVRNGAVKHSRGSWIALLDSDDLWEPEKLARQARYIQDHPSLRLVHTREKWLRDEKIVSQKKQKHRREGDIFQDALVKCIIGPSTTVIRRDLWEETGGFREDLEIAEDYELWLRITAGEPVGYIDTPLITKRAGEWDQLSEKYGQIEKFRLQGLGDLVESGWFREHSGPDRAALAEGEYGRKCRIYALGCEKRGRREEALFWRNRAAPFVDPQGDSP